MNQPLYGASPGQAVKRFFKKYARFSGYASRSEYWWVQLFLFVLYLLVGTPFYVTMASAVLNSADTTTATTSTSASIEVTGGTAAGLFIFGILQFLIALALLIPNLALMWRRLHDAGFPGPFFFLAFIPGVGGIIVLVLTLMPTNQSKWRPEWHDHGAP